MPRTYITLPPEERFWKHVDKNGPVPENHPELGNCWLWTGTIDPQGYGHFYDGTKTANGYSRLVYAHRFAYGKVPDGLEISHLCETENCVRREHLVAVTHRENTHYGNGLTAQKAAKTECLRGHAFNEANTIIRRNGTRRCRTCTNLRNNAYHARLRNR